MPKRCELDKAHSIAIQEPVVVCDKKKKELEEAAKKAAEQPKLKTVTVCDEDTLLCEDKQIPAHVGIDDNLPESCRLE